VRHVIRRGCFDAWLASGRTAPAVLNHDPDRPVGGSLAFKADARGLRFVIRDYDAPPEVTGVSLTFRNSLYEDAGDGVKEFLGADIEHLAILLPPKGPAFPRLSRHLESDWETDLMWRLQELREQED
jgi:hypothetical protein